jgi:hypothetical protein
LGETGKTPTNPNKQIRDRARSKRRHLTDPRQAMFRNAKRRALAKRVPFSLSIDDIVIPAVCPALGLPLSVGRSGLAHDGSPTLDRIVPELGYVPGNVIVISRRANNIKSNAYPAELLTVARWLETVMETAWKNIGPSASSAESPTPPSTSSAPSAKTRPRD